MKLDKSPGGPYAQHITVGYNGSRQDHPKSTDIHISEGAKKWN